MSKSKNLEEVKKRKALLDREIMAYHQAGVEVPADLEEAYLNLQENSRDQTGMTPSGQGQESPGVTVSSTETKPVSAPDSWTGWLGRKAGDYILLHLLHEGSYTWVFEAEPSAGKTGETPGKTKGQKVAIKLPRNPIEYKMEMESNLDDKSLALSSEGGLLVPTYSAVVEEQTSRLRKAGSPFVPVLESGSVDGTPFYVMPLLAGRSLEAMLKEKDFSGCLTSFNKVLESLGKAQASTLSQAYFSNLAPRHVIIEDGEPVFLDAGSSGWLTTSEGRVKGAMTTRRYNPDRENAPWRALSFILMEIASGASSSLQENSADYQHIVQELQALLQDGSSPGPESLTNLTAKLADILKTPK